jgi:ABC-type dipeptide/oligopeptide/nickel transport system ATPase subunit
VALARALAPKPACWAAGRVSSNLDVIASAQAHECTILKAAQTTALFCHPINWRLAYIGDTIGVDVHEGELNNGMTLYTCTTALPRGLWRNSLAGLL